MRRRTQAFIGTFQNTEEGLNQYSNLTKLIRRHFLNGTFSKKFRGKPRGIRYKGLEPLTGKLYTIYNCSSTKSGASHFDAYIHRLTPPSYKILHSILIKSK